MAGAERADESAFRSEHVAVTSAPKYAASCTAKCPTPPAAAWMSMRWPSCARAVSITAPHAVSEARGTPAASANPSEAGIGATLIDETVMNSA